MKTRKLYKKQEVETVEGETMSFVRERKYQNQTLTLGEKTDAIINFCRELGMGVVSMSHSVDSGENIRINIEVIAPTNNNLYGDIWKDDPDHTIPELDMPPTEKELEEEKGII